MSELDNYNALDNYDAKGWDLSYAPWYSAEVLAWVCNQRNDCSGFVFDKGKGYGGWFKNKDWWNNSHPNHDNNRFVFGKKDFNWRKADNPDTSNLSILPRDEMQTRMPAVGFNNWNDYSFSTGTTCCGQSGYPRCNDMNSYKVPLGWKWMITNDGIISGTTVEGYWDRDNMGWGGQFDLDHPNGHGMMDRDDCVLAQNIGFDIPSNFDSMVSKGVHPTDALKIRHNWCKANTTNINDPKCTNFYSTPEAAAAGFKYDQDLFYLCKADPNWFQKKTTPDCRTAINNAVKGTNESIRQQAKDLVTTYCETDAGKNQPDGLCGCYNVMKYGGQCLTTQGGIPGCKELKATVGDLPPGAQVAFADKFCASDVCVTQALGNAALLPDYTQGKQCPNIAQCVQDFRHANFQGSQVDASCKNTINISGVAAPAPPAGPAPAPAPPAGPAPAPAPAAGTPATPASNTPIPAGKSTFVDNYINTPQKQYAFIGCCVVLILLCLFAMFSGGQQGIDPMMFAMMAR
jgi:hypothetical protein